MVLRIIKKKLAPKAAKYIKQSKNCIIVFFICEFLRLFKVVGQCRLCCLVIFTKLKTALISKKNIIL